MHNLTHPSLSWRPDPPLVVILRGVAPGEASGVCAALYTAGVRCVETPLNSPDALASIRLLAAVFGQRMLVGAGTVLNAADLEAVASAGATFAVSPHLDVALIAQARARGLAFLPGVFTPSECMAAMDAGAVALKLFPSDVSGPAYVKALKPALRKARFYPTGGVTPALIGPYLAAGAEGLGVGTALYRPGETPASVGERAAAFMRAYAAAKR